jgi:cation:H+ antiporter
MTSIFVFLAGAALLIYCAEKLIGGLVRVASGLRVSVFLLAIIITGIEFDDVFLGLALNIEELEEVALGVVFGTAISMAGIVLAVAAIVTPGRVNIPRDYIAIFAVAPLVMIVFTLRAPLTVVDGIVLIALFVLFISYIAVRESRGETPVFRDAEMYEAYAAVRGGPGTPQGSAPGTATGTATLSRDTETHPPDAGAGGAGEPPGGPAGPGGRSLADTVLSTGARKHSGWTGLGLTVLALAGLIAGAWITGMGTEGILETYELEGTLFGATIATVVLTMEDIFLTVEPARKGAPEIGVGNVIGSVVFSVTGKLGIILLAGGLVAGAGVLTWHLPAFIVLTGVAAYFLSGGRLTRWHGYLLLTFYVVYWVVSFVVFGVVPADAD